MSSRSRSPSRSLPRGRSTSGSRDGEEHGGRRFRSRSGSRRNRRSRSRSRPRDRSYSRSPRRLKPRSHSRSPSPEEVRSLYVTGFSPGNTNARDLVDRFDEVGKVERIHMKEKFAFITMKSGASKAVREFDGATFQGKKLRVEFVKGRGVPEHRGEKIPPSKTLFVVNFDPQRTNKADVEDFFRGFKVRDVELSDKWAFVTMETLEDAEDAVKDLDGRWLGDRQITVTFKAAETSSRGDGGRGRGGGRKRPRSPPRRGGYGPPGGGGYGPPEGFVIPNWLKNIRGLPPGIPPFFPPFFPPPPQFGRDRSRSPPRQRRRSPPRRRRSRSR